MEPKLSKQLYDANVYVEKNKIEKLISDLINQTVQSRNDKPIIYMIKTLASLTSPEILHENGIKIQISNHKPINH